MDKTTMDNILDELNELKDKYIKIAAKARFNGSEEEQLFRGKYAGIAEAILVVESAINEEPNE